MTPTWQSDDGRVQLYCADCLAAMPALAADSVDAIVTDPPYGLGFMGKDWDKLGCNVAFTENERGGLGGYKHHIRYGEDTGAMQEWHYRWAVGALRVAKPGAHLLAFGGTRTFHRLACAIEDAGWEIRDTVMWVYGSGFPKSLNVGRSIDTELCAEAGRHCWNPPKDKDEPWHICERTPAGVGHDNNGTALKPAWEPVVVARKPLDGTVAQNVLKWGTGALNIDGCRIEGTAGNGHWSGDDGSDATSLPGYDGGFTRGGKRATGRFPANLVHDGSEEVVGMFPQAGTVFDGGQVFEMGGSLSRRPLIESPAPASAARFFYCAKASKQDRDEGCGLLEKRPGGSNCKGYVDDVARGLDRNRPVANHHPTVKPVALMRYLCRLVTPPNGLILDPFAGSGSTGKAAVIDGFRFVGIELDGEYCEIAKRRIEAERAQGRLFEK